MKVMGQLSLAIHDNCTVYLEEFRTSTLQKEETNEQQ